MAKTKGSETEEKAEALYNAAGYRTWTPPKAKYREQDVFGLYDVLALGHGELVGVQCKTNKARGINEWSTDAGFVDGIVDGLRSEMIVRYPDEGWRLVRLDDQEYYVAFDGREIDETPAPVLDDVLNGPGESTRS